MTTNHPLRIAFVKPEDPNLHGNNIIFDYFRDRERFEPGSLHIYRLADLAPLALAGRLAPGDLPLHRDEDATGRVTGDEPADLVYLGPKSQQSPRAWEIAAAFRARGAAVVAGGPHVTAVPDDARGRVDALLIGEEDLPFDRMIADFRAGGRAALAPEYRAEGFADLSLAPPPRYDLLDPARYGMLPVQATRGCPHACRFCFSSRMWGRAIRRKPVAAVIGEVRTLGRLSPVPLFFTDDNLLADRAYARELLSALAGEGVRWSTFTDISFADDDALLDLLPAAGCAEVLIGFETIRERAMGQVSEFKRRALARYPESIRRIQDRGIGVIGSFVVGFDEDTPETFDELARFLDENPLHEISISILTPYPGTELFAAFEREGRILTRDWGRYSDLSWNVNYRPARLTPEEIRSGVTRLLDRVYSPEASRRRTRHFIELAKRRRA